MFKRGQYLSKEEESELMRAIVEAEKSTSGEIRIHIERKCLESDPVKRAKKLFVKLGMEKTAARNGVLFYIAWADRKFAIWGDEGINLVVPPRFWDEIRDVMTMHLAKEEKLLALKNGVTKVGEKLKEYFPIKNMDTNELPNTISFS